MTSGTTEEHGQATVLVIGLSLVVFAIAGLAVDGTRAFLIRRSLQSSADAAALAAAAELDEAAYYASGGKVAVLDEPAARRSAAEWLQSRGLPLKAEVATAPDRVEVVVRAVLPTTFLGLAGITEIPVAARADASPIAGGPDPICRPFRLCRAGKGNPATEWREPIWWAGNPDEG